MAFLICCFVPASVTAQDASDAGTAAQTAMPPKPDTGRADALHFIRQCRDIAAVYTETPPETADLQAACQKAGDYCDAIARPDYTSAHPWHKSAGAAAYCADIRKICSGIQTSGRQSGDDGTNSAPKQSLAENIVQFCNAAACRGTPLPAVMPFVDGSSREKIETLADTLGLTLEITDDEAKITAENDPSGALDNYAIIGDDTLKTLLSLLKDIRKSDGISEESLLEDELAAMFESGGRKADNDKKLAVYATILPSLIRHARSSGSAVTLQNLQSIEQTLERQKMTQTIGLSCTTHTDHRSYKIQYPASILTESTEITGPVRVSISTALECPTEEEIDQTSSESDNGAIICRSILLPAAVKSPASPEDIMLETLLALESRSSIRISALMPKLAQMLEYRSKTHERPAPEWSCRLNTIYLAALDQDRYAELTRIESAMSEIYAGTTFYDRLAQFESCLETSDGEYTAAAHELWGENEDRYKWIIRHFAPKSKKKLPKAFRSWTKSRNLKVTQPRRELAAWTAWCRGDYQSAAKYAEYITKKKSRLVHPQLHSFDMMIKIAANGCPDQETIAGYVRSIMLKTPPLAYQAMTAVAPLVTSQDRKIIAEVFRAYPPATASNAAAHFLTAYRDEICAPLSAAQTAAIDAWLDTELTAEESPCETALRRLAWLDDLVKAQNYSGIRKLAALAVDSPIPAPPHIRALWTQIDAHAQNMITPGSVSDRMPRTVSFYEKCQAPNKTDSAEYLENVYRCWTLNMK